jgi:uncharacterized membrane protein YuzA (DUF378 family)
MSLSTEAAVTIGFIIVGLCAVALMLPLAVLSLLRSRKQTSAGHSRGI